MGDIKTYRATVATWEVTLLLVSPINDQDLPTTPDNAYVVRHLFQRLAETVPVGLIIQCLVFTHLRFLKLVVLNLDSIA